MDAAAIHRGLDFYYLCYDNESYANTGFQTSASTPYGARTSTEPITPRSPHGRVHGRRDLFEIWRVQRPPYLATISAAYPLDLSEKVYRASKFTGPKLFIALSARLRRSIPNGRSMIARSAVETGIWPLKEAIHGEVTHTYVPRRFEPVENYLNRQGRFRHLFEPKLDEEAISHIQATVDHYWSAALQDNKRIDYKASEEPPFHRIFEALGQWNLVGLKVGIFWIFRQVAPIIGI